MSRYKVLLTDYAWPELDLERSILGEVDAELVVATAKDADSLAELAKQNDVDAIMTNWAKVPDSVLAVAPKCRVVARLGIGLDNIDVAGATRRKMLVTNVPDYCLIEVAEHALAMILALGRKIAFYHHETQSGRYDLAAGATLRRIEGQTLGIVGLGNIGLKLAAKAQALGLKILATARTRKPAPGVTYCDLDTLLAESDYVSLHLPAVAETRRMIGAAQFSRMKPTAYLINTARGALIDHAALATALNAGQLAGAALDVQDPEPPDLSQTPYNDPRVIVTPHAAFVSVESLTNLRVRASHQVATALVGGRPENVVNPEVLG